MHHELPAMPIEILNPYSFRRIYFGFGYDCVNDDYKVVRIVKFYDIVDFYTLNSLIELDYLLKSRNCCTKIVGSCNGLLCLCDSDSNVMLWNPSMRMHHASLLTPIEILYHSYENQFVTFGFRYDRVNNDYKVMRIVQSSDEIGESFDSEVKVYSLKTNLWRRIQDLPYYFHYEWDFDSLDNAIELEFPLESLFWTHILGSCNGLLCSYKTKEDLVLWNFSTRNFRRLPLTLIEFLAYFITQREFGYDFINDDYKVVRIVQFNGSFDSEVKVYSLKKNSWRRIQGFPYYLHHEQEWGIFAGGALNWVATQTRESNKKLIVAFDHGVEEYQEVPQPKFLDKNFLMTLGVLGGCLCILANYQNNRADIWMMKSGDEVLFEWGCTNLFRYDLKKNEVKNVEIRSMPHLPRAYICIGSLVLLNGNSGIDGKKQQAQDLKKNTKKRVHLIV
ncbi:hypothetical protein L1049_010717 [Liquidambar formosana]|uniref:F-box protein n=1 Tax=Liquidambar formosana TaxID=63359 RepID=A0AAP0R4S6_LIQFO